MKKQTKKIVALAMTGVLGLGLGAGIGASLFPQTQQVTVEKEVLDVPAYKKAFKEGKASVDVEAIQELSFKEGVESVEPEVINNTVEKIVEVDNGKLDLVQDFIYDRDGKIQFITDDMDDDEVDMIADRIVFFNDSVKLASDFIKEELADELDKEVVNGEELDEDDIEKVKVEDDFEDVKVLDSDFEDKELELEFEVEFEQDDIDYVARVKVDVEGDKADNLEILEINEE